MEAPLFLDDKDYYPRRWSNMSLDMRMVFVLFGASMPLFLLGGSGVTPWFVQLGLEGAGLALIITISVVNRRRAGWRWRGVGPKQVLGAALSFGAIGLFLFVSVPAMGAQMPLLATWIFMAALLGGFNVLGSLRLVRQSQEAFEADCREETPEAAAQPALVSDAPGTDWRVWVKRIWMTLFVLVWLGGMATFYFQSRAPGGMSGASLPMDGWLGLLTVFWMAGTFVVLISGFLLHYVFRIRVLPNMPLPGEPRR